MTRTAATPALLALILGLACASSPGDRDARIRVERAERTGYWRVTYQLAAPTDCLLFQRPAAFYRESVWEVVTPGFRLDRSGDRPTLMGDTPSDRIVVEFPEYTDNLPKEYELFTSFTDGSVGLYTGHLYATPSLCEPPEDDNGVDYLRRVELTPPPGGRVVVHGEVVEEVIVWDDPHHAGTYVYLGAIEPLETDAMVAIVDPGAPAWLVERMHRLLPEMFAVYGERFGEPLPSKPVVLFSFEDVELSGTSSGGGTLHGLVQMSARGKAWHDATPDTAEQLLYLVAHEAAHLWNGQLHPYAEMEDSWMHEGSADAFARLMLRRADAIDDDLLAERRTEALNRCSLGLGAGSLTSSAERQQFRNYYACGEVIAVWSVGVLPEAYDDGRLFDLWRAIFERADPEDGHYDRETYLDALVSLGADPSRVDALRRFVDEEHADPSAALIDFLALAEIEIETLDRPLPALRRDRAAGALRHLMEDACDGRYSFHTEGRRLRTAVLDDCEPFSRELRVVSIEGHDFGPAGDLALQAAAARCAEGGTVELGLEDGTTVSIPCGTAPPAEPAPLAFPRLASR